MWGPEIAHCRAAGQSWNTIARAAGMSPTGIRKRLAKWEARNPEAVEESNGVAGTQPAAFAQPHIGFRVPGARRESVINPRNGRTLRPPNSPYARWLDEHDGF